MASTYWKIHPFLILILIHRRPTNCSSFSRFAPSSLYEDVCNSSKCKQGVVYLPTHRQLTERSIVNLFRLGSITAVLLSQRNVVSSNLNTTPKTNPVNKSISLVSRVSGGGWWLVTGNIQVHEAKVKWKPKTIKLSCQLDCFGGSFGVPEWSGTECEKEAKKTFVSTEAVNFITFEKLLSINKI